MIFACQIDSVPDQVRIFPQSGKKKFPCFFMFKYYFFIIWEYLLILPKNLEMPSIGTPKIHRFKIIVSMCECCCPFFIFCLFFAFQRKVWILTKQKSLTTMYLVNFYKWSESTTLSDHLSFFCLLGTKCWKLFSIVAQFLNVFF